MREDKVVNLFREDIGPYVRDIPVNDNFVSNYPSADGYNVIDFIKGVPMLDALIAYLDLFDPEALFEVMDAREFDKIQRDSDGYSVESLNRSDFTYAYTKYAASMRSKILADEKLVQIDIRQVVEVDNDEDRVVHMHPISMHVSVPFAIALLEDIAFLTQKTNRYVGALGFLTTAIAARSYIRLFETKAQSYTAIGALRDNENEGILEFTFFPITAGATFLFSVSSASITLDKSIRYPWTPSKSFDLDDEGYHCDVSPEFREIFDEIERRLQPRIQHEIRDAFYVARPYNISYITGLIEGALQVFNENESTSSLQNTKHFSSTVEAFKAAHLDLKTNYTDGDKLPEEYREQLHKLFVGASKYLADYTIKDRGFVKSDEQDIPLADDFTPLGTGEGGEVVTPAKSILSPQDADGKRQKTVKSPVSFIPDVKAALKAVADDENVSGSVLVNEILANDPRIRAALKRIRQPN